MSARPTVTRASSIVLATCIAATRIPICQAMQDTSTMFSRFLDTQKKREELLVRHTIRYVEVVLTEGPQKQEAAAFVEYTRVGDTEKLVRYAIQRDLSALRATEGVEAFSKQAHSSIRPSIYVSDCARTLSLTPSARNEKLWEGRLRVTLDVSYRGGALDCCMMFGERWLSEQCSEFKLISYEHKDSADTIVMVAGQSQPNDRIVLELSPTDLTPMKLSWFKGETLNFAASVTTTTTLDDNIRVPATGTIKYSYGSKSQLDLRFAYEKHGAVALGSVAELPTEVVNSKGAARIEDEVSGSDILLGDHVILDSLPKRRFVAKRTSGVSNLAFLFSGSALAITAALAYWILRRRARSPS